MHELQIDASPSQIKRLHRGHKVRVKKGTGFCLIVHPQTYNIANRAFNKGKGAQLQLTQEEIQASQGISPEQHNPPLQPVSSGSGIRDIFSHVKLADTLNKQLGSNYGYLQRAGLDNAIQGAKSAAMSKMGIDARFAQGTGNHYAQGYRLSGLGVNEPRSRLVGGQIEKSSVGRNGGMLSVYTPPALVSQPFSANFQFQHFLPPQYQHFNSGGHTDFGGHGFH